jgi:CrcB protein
LHKFKHLTAMARARETRGKRQKLVKENCAESSWNGYIWARTRPMIAFWQGHARDSRRYASGRGAAMGAAMSAVISPLMASLNVALGGAIGAVARYQLGRGMTHWLGPQVVTTFPWATLAANIIGSLAMGMLAGWMARHGGETNINSEQMRLLLGVGLLGGFTTFSAFSLEMMMLVERGQAASAVTYSAVSVLAGLAALYLGLIIMRIAA